VTRLRAIKKPLRLSVRMSVALVVFAFTLATFKCALGNALEGPNEHEHGQASASHQSQPGSDSDHHGDTDSPDCCSSLKSVAPTVSRVELKPLQVTTFLIPVVAEWPLSTVIPSPTGSIHDHGPPGLSPPEFLLVSSFSPRSPPRLA
jgi:hypothetical protein